MKELSVSHSVVPDSLWPMDCSLPGSSVHEILQERILEGIAITFSRGSSQPRDRTQVSLALQADFLPTKLQYPYSPIFQSKHRIWLFFFSFKKFLIKVLWCSFVCFEHSCLTGYFMDIILLAWIGHFPDHLQTECECTWGNYWFCFFNVIPMT